MIRSIFVVASASVLMSCSATNSDATATGGLTAGESERLEAAADRLDAQPPSPAQEQSQALEARSRAELEEQRRQIEAR